MISGSSSKLTSSPSPASVSLTSISEEIGDPSEDFREDDDSLLDFESSFAIKSSNCV